jgi:hypothetical protein
MHPQHRYEYQGLDMTAGAGASREGQEGEEAVCGQGRARGKEWGKGPNGQNGRNHVRPVSVTATTELGKRSVNIGRGALMYGR